MSSQSASRQFRQRVGLPPREQAVEVEEVEELDPDEDMGRGEPPEDPERSEPQPGADEDGFGGDAPAPAEDPFPGDNA